jgi:hypothetical protein
LLELCVLAKDGKYYDSKKRLSFYPERQPLLFGACVINKAITDQDDSAVRSSLALFDL